MNPSMKTIRFFLALPVFAATALTTGAAAEPLWQHEVELPVGKAAVETPVAADGTILVSLEMAAGPEKWDWHGVAETAAGNKRGRRFRFPAGEHVLSLGDRWGKTVEAGATFRVSAYQETDTSEPANDSAETPRLIQVGEISGCAIFPEGDVDHLRVECPRRGYLFVELAGPVEGFTLAAELIDEDGHKLGVNQARLEVGGPVTLAVRDRWGNFASMEPLPLRVTWFPETDAGEPNDGPEDAVELELAQWHEALMAPIGDEDYFRVPVDGTGYLSVEGFDWPENIELVWTLRDPQTGEPLQTRWPVAVEPGEYLVSVRERWNNRWSMEPFRFCLRFTPAAKITPREAAEAVTMADGEVRRIRLMQPGEQDRLAVEVTGPSLVRVSAEAAGSGVLVIRDATGREGNPLWIRTSGAERHELTVRERWEKPVPGKLEVAVEMVPEVDPGEPNSLSDPATPLRPGERVAFFLFPEDDVDGFDAKHLPAESLRVRVECPAGEAGRFPQGLMLAAHDEAGERLGQWNLAAAREAFELRGFELPAETSRLVLTGNGHASPHELSLLVTAESREGPAADAGVHVVGIELEEAARARMADAIEAAGGSFHSADQAEDIAMALSKVGDEVLGTAEEPTVVPPARGVWVWILGALAAMVAGCVVWRMLSRHRAR